MSAEPTRGGPQRIPRPAGFEPGRPAPWAGASADARHLTFDRIRRSLAEAGPARRAPREHEAVRGSAVLAPLYLHDGDVHVVLTRRSSALRVHSGEVSFPGGGRDEGERLLDTALREAHEEIGLDPGAVEVVGELDHLGTITSGSFIVPFVGVLPGRPHLTPSPAEVDAVLHVPLAELLDPAVYREERWPIFGAERSIFFFELVGDTIWGATAAMLRQLLGIATGTVGRGDLRHE